MRTGKGSISLPTHQIKLENGDELNIALEVRLDSGLESTVTITKPFAIEVETMNIRFLKIKLKSLAAEARIIRLEELRTRGDLRESLYLHRIMKVRRECRDTHLAYGFLRGRTYLQLERSCTVPPDWKNVARMVFKYGAVGSEKEAAAVLNDWKNGTFILEKAA
jgi:hypothetical protein